jgi:ATP-dependent Lon protease
MVLPYEVPVMTVANATLFPQALLPLHIFEPRYRRMLADCLKSHRMFALAMQRPGRTRETPCAVAGLGLIRVSVEHKDRTSHLILQGIARVELGPAVKYKPYRVHTISALEANTTHSGQIVPLVARVHKLVEQRINLGSFPMPFPLPDGGEGIDAELGELPPSKFSVSDVLNYLKSLHDANQLADLVSCALLPRASERQSILETVDLEARLLRLIQYLMDEIARTRKVK